MRLRSSWGTHLLRVWRRVRTATKEVMTPHTIGRTIIVALTLAFTGAAFSQAPPSRSEVAAPAKGSAEVLKGTWVRPDGGYRIAIDGVGPDGKLDAMYFNPTRLPFAKAQVSQDGGTFRIVLELQAGGYAGSTYDLRYEPATNRLEGTFYQAVAKQKFDVYFARQ